MLCSWVCRVRRQMRGKTNAAATPEPIKTKLAGNLKIPDNVAQTTITNRLKIKLATRSFKPFLSSGIANCRATVRLSPAVAGITPLSKACAEAQFSTPLNPAAKIVVIMVLGRSKPIKTAAIPFQPLSFRPIRIETATILIPGVSWHKAQNPLISSSVSQLRLVICSRRIKYMVDEPPPKDCPPISSQTRKISQKFILRRRASIRRPRNCSGRVDQLFIGHLLIAFLSLYTPFFRVLIYRSVKALGSYDVFKVGPVVISF